MKSFSRKKKRRASFIKVFVTEDEHRIIVNEADAQGLSISAWARSKILKVLHGPDELLEL